MILNHTFYKKVLSKMKLKNIKIWNKYTIYFNQMHLK